MSDQSYTAQQASDPATPAQVLADIAAVRPDLRPAIAANPSAYPSLLEWLGSLGEPAVDSALKQRASSGASDVQSTTVLPTTPGGDGGQVGQPGQASGGGYGQQSGFPAGQATPAGYGLPPAGQAGQGGNAPYGATPPYGGGGAPYGAAPGPASLPPQGYGGYQPAPQGSGSKKALWIVLAVVAFLIVLAVAGFFIVRNLVSNALPDFEVGEGTYGDDPALDVLWDACEAEDWAACDDLYLDSPIGSDYERFGDTCGERMEAGTEIFCVDEFGDASAEEPSDLGDTETEAPPSEDPAEPFAYGDDPALDALYDQCGAGDLAACDQLWNESPVGSDYEAFAFTCGGTTEGGSTCATEAVDPSTANTYGDDPVLDVLWDRCAAEDWAACDALYQESPVASEYETFGDTCGNRQEAGTQTFCTDQFG